MNRKIVIALSGFKGSGKDTAGDILVRNHGFVQYSFADPLKGALSSMFGWNPNLLLGKSGPSRQWREQTDEWWSQALGQEITPRTMMQRVGTEVIRKKLHNDFWTLACKRFIENQSSHVVITDARFRNELDMIRSIGGYTVRVVRGNDPAWFKKQEKLNKLPAFTRKVFSAFYPHTHTNHISERDWIGYKFDWTLNNNDGLDFLERQLDAVIHLIKRI
jgi:hypothetical protein